MISAADKVNAFLSTIGWNEITVSRAYYPKDKDMVWVWTIYVDGEDRGLFLYTDKEPDTTPEITAIGCAAVTWYTRYFDGGEQDESILPAE